MTLNVVGGAPAVKADATSVTVRTITVPAGIAAGDGFLMVATMASGSATFTLDNTLSKVFTQVGASATASGHTSALFKLAGAAALDAGKIITITSSVALRMSVVLYALNGVDATDFVDTFASKVSTVGTLTPTTPTAVTGWPSCGIISFVEPTRGGSIPNVAAATAPAGHTLDALVASGAGTSSTAALGGHNWSTVPQGTTIGGDTWTLDVSAIYGAFIVSIKQAAIAASVNAGPAQTIAAGSTLTLQSTETGAATGAWSQVSGPAVTINTPTATLATVTAIPAGNYVFRRTITDAQGVQKTSDVAVTVTATTARPDATLSNTGGWTVQGGAASNEAALADESDLTFVQSPDTPTGAEFTERLSPLSVPTDLGGGKLTLRMRAVGAASNTNTIELIGSTGIVRKTWTQVVTATWADYPLILDATSAATITDWTALRFRITTTAT